MLRKDGLDQRKVEELQLIPGIKTVSQLCFDYDDSFVDNYQCIRLRPTRPFGILELDPGPYMELAELRRKMLPELGHNLPLVPSALGFSSAGARGLHFPLRQFRPLKPRYHPDLPV